MRRTYLSLRFDRFICVSIVVTTMIRQRHIPSEATPLYEENGWSKTTAGFEKDGYEIYFMKGGGVELTVRNHETGEREAVVKRDRLSHKQPLTAAIVCHFLENAESVVLCYNEQQKKD